MVGQTEFHERVIEVLRASKVFSLLDDAVLRQLAAMLERQDVQGGHLVLREGDPSDSMLFIVSGRLRVSRRAPDGSTLLYNEIRAGESVGETGLILQQARTADVTAVRDSTLAVLSRQHFETLLALQPLALNRVFAQAIYNHLRHAPQLVEQPLAQSYVVVPLHLGAGAHAVARGLKGAFAQTSRACHLTPASGRMLEAGAVAAPHQEHWHDRFERDYDHIVYEADDQASAWTRLACRQADQVIFVANADAPVDARSELSQQLAQDPGFSMKRQHLVVLHPADAAHPRAIDRWQSASAFERVYPVREDHAGDHARVSRFVNGSAVGVVLGGGGARGFAHLGVLRALEEAGIPIDMIGGNSMGALIGAQYACGVPLDEIRDRTRRFALGGEKLTLPVISLASGHRVRRDLQKMFGDMAFESLWRPFFAAACNLSQACTTVQDTGPLWRAVLASNSPAGLLPPVLHRGDLLVDGAILENVPVGAMRMRLGTPLEKRRGNGTIIAIDVDVQEELGVDPALAQLPVWRTLKGYLRLAKKTTPGIGEILYRAGHIGGLNQRAHTIAQADHYLEPPVADFPLMGYRRAEEIIDIGYRHAQAAIAQWDRASLPH